MTRRDLLSSTALGGTVAIPDPPPPPPAIDWSRHVPNDVVYLARDGLRRVSDITGCWIDESGQITADMIATLAKQKGGR